MSGHASKPGAERAIVATARPGNSQGEAASAWTGGVFFVVWAEDPAAGGTAQVYGARVRPDGTVLDPGGILLSTRADDNWLACRPTRRRTPHRSKRIMVNVAAFYDGPEDPLVRAAWVDDVVAGLQQGDDAAYVNFLTDEGPERVRAAYPGATWDRLAAVKTTYDPENFFRLNQNVPPATSDRRS